MKKNMLTIFLVTIFFVTNVSGATIGFALNKVADAATNEKSVMRDTGKALEPPVLSAAIESGIPKLEWASEIPESDILWKSGFEAAETSKIELVYNSKNGHGDGGQKFDTSQAYSGKQSLYTPTTTPGKGNWVLYPYTGTTDYNHVFYNGDKVTFKNGDKISISYKTKSNKNMVVSVRGDWASGNKIIPLKGKLATDYKAGQKTFKVTDTSDLEVSMYLTLDTDNDSVGTPYRISDINHNTKEVSLSAAFPVDLAAGYTLKYRKAIWPFEDSNKLIKGSSDWVLTNVNLIVSNTSDIDWSKNPVGLRQMWKTFDEAWIDDVQIGYATKARIYRDGSKIYEGYDSEYTDSSAVDNAIPTNVTGVSKNVSFNPTSKKKDISLSFTAGVDKGTAYRYNVSSVSKANVESSQSPNKNLTVTSGLKGYSYVIDKNSNTSVANTVNLSKDSTSISYSIDSQDTSDYYLHIKAIDNNNNVSDTLHYKIDTNIAKPTAPILNMTPSTTNWANSNIDIQWRISNGVDISKVVLPDGTETTDASSVYEVSSNGTYSFVVYDIYGFSYLYSIEITNIDKVAPTITTSVSTTAYTTQDVVITVSADDNASFSKIILPDDSQVASKNATYLVSSNGKYVFKVLDEAGNITTETVTVSNIDRVPPRIATSVNTTEYTNQDVIITVSADDDVLFDKIVLPDNSEVTSKTTTYSVSSNGVYTFTVVDAAGNTRADTVTVSNIDKVAPTIATSVNTKEITNEDVVITVSADDDVLFDKIILPDNSEVNLNNTTYIASSNGTYIFKVVDAAGNITTETVVISNIDKIPPIVSLAPDVVDELINSVNIAVEVSDNVGISKIILPNGDEITEGTFAFTVYENGEYEFIVIDMAGNETVKVITISNINTLSILLSNNVVSFGEIDGYESVEKLDGVNVTVTSSLPYDLDILAVTDMQGGLSSNAIESTKLSAKTGVNDYVDISKDYKSLINGAPNGVDIKHSIDFKLDSTVGAPSDSYSVMLKLKVSQK